MRQQPRAGQDPKTQLLEEGDSVELEPVLGDLPVHHAVDLDAGEVHLAVGRRKAPKVPGVRAGEQDALRDHVLVGRGALDLHAQIGEALEEHAFASELASPVSRDASGQQRGDRSVRGAPNRQRTGQGVQADSIDGTASASRRGGPAAVRSGDTRPEALGQPVIRV